MLAALEYRDAQVGIPPARLSRGTHARTVAPNYHQALMGHLYLLGRLIPGRAKLSTLLEGLSIAAGLSHRPLSMANRTRQTSRIML